VGYGPRVNGYCPGKPAEPSFECKEPKYEQKLQQVKSREYFNTTGDVEFMERLRNASYAYQELERNKHIADIYQKFIDEPTDYNYMVVIYANYLLEGIYFYNGFNFFYTCKEKRFVCQGRSHV